MKYHLQQGMTMIELMIVVAIIGILTAIGIPTYSNYIKTSCMSTAGMNLQTLRTHQEAARIEYGTYTAGTHDGAAPAGSTLAGFENGKPKAIAPLYWAPDDNNEFSYEVTFGSTGDIATSYNISVTGLGGCNNIDAITDGI